MAALIHEALGRSAEVVVGRRGEFSVWVGATRVAQKTGGEFPSDEEIVAAVRAAIGS